MIEDIRKIADHFGAENQRKKAIEELGELIEAIENISKEDNAQNYVNLIEEIADVAIMLEQIKYLHGIDSSHIDGAVGMKIDRTLNRYGIGGCEDDRSRK